MDYCCCVVIYRWRLTEWESISFFTKINSCFHVRINDAYQPDSSTRWIKSNRMISFNSSYKTGIPWLWALSLSLPFLGFTQVLCTYCTKERHWLCDMSCVCCVCFSVHLQASYPKLLNMILYSWAIFMYLIWIILVHRGVLWWTDWLFSRFLA
jgi:hypothetical protein